ncbi:MAG: NADH-quinone oxidoreductase subunit J [Actinomycetota bacterium]|nr:NADH-quinone oxidoreductase subunit J [Actinomycetota bacterium]
MSLSDWLSTSENWVFLVIALPMLAAAVKLVTTTNVVHAALYLVVTLAASAAVLLLLGAEFVAWTVVLVSIGAVVVLFLIGIMITRAPMGHEATLSHPRSVKLAAAVVSFALFALVGGAVIDAFTNQPLTEPADATRTGALGEVLFTRFVIPFEVVSVLLLAALIGGIVLARRDPGETSGGGL